MKKKLSNLNHMKILLKKLKRKMKKFLKNRKPLKIIKSLKMKFSKNQLKNKPMKNKPMKNKLLKNKLLKNRLKNLFNTLKKKLLKKI